MKVYVITSVYDCTVYGVFDEESPARDAAERVHKYTGELIDILIYDLNSMKSFDDYVSQDNTSKTPKPDLKDISWSV